MPFNLISVWVLFEKKCHVLKKTTSLRFLKKCPWVFGRRPKHLGFFLLEFFKSVKKNPCNRIKTQFMCIWVAIGLLSPIDFKCEKFVQKKFKVYTTIEQVKNKCTQVLYSQNLSRLCFLVFYSHPPLRLDWRWKLRNEPFYAAPLAKSLTLQEIIGGLVRYPHCP